MTDWPDRLLACMAAETAVVLVMLADRHGSAPRESGATMIVGTDLQLGSIGGGRLEWLALAEARALLMDDTACTRLVRYPLAASAGQCCGGVVWLSYERIGSADRNWLEEARQITRRGGRWLRAWQHPRAPGAVRIFTADALRNEGGAAIDTATARDLLSRAEGGACRTHVDPTRDERLQPADTGLLQVSPEAPLPVYIFGAGHVGRALVEVLARLPMHIRWMDEREEEFPHHVPENVEVHLTDAPLQALAGAPDDGVFLVLTHSHALDFTLVHAILSRGRFRFLGLIGSRSKRAAFVQRLAARGLPAERIARLTCPIGQPEISGKSPQVIAVSVAAQLLQLPRTPAQSPVPCTEAGTPA